MLISISIMATTKKDEIDVENENGSAQEDNNNPEGLAVDEVLVSDVATDPMDSEECESIDDYKTVFVTDTRQKPLKGVDDTVVEVGAV